MDTGTKISGVAHIGVIGAALFGGVFTSGSPPVVVREVSVISAQDYAALTATTQPPVVAEQPTALAPPDTEPDAPDVTAQPDVEPDQARPDATEQPVSEDAPEAVSEPPAPEADVSDAAPVLEPPQEQAALVDAPTRDTAVPRASDRVAPQPVAPQPPDTRPDEVASPEVAPDEGAEKPQEPKEATAPEEAADRIVTEADDPAANAPRRSPRPPSRPTRRTAAKPEPKPTQKPTPKAEPPTKTAVESALAEALGGSQNAAPAPSGPPLSAGEKDALRVAVQRCWNVGSLSSEAISTTVVVAVTMTQDAKPQAGSIRMLSSSGGTAESARRAYEAARRAIIRCGASGYKLPKEKYSQWRDIEMTFNPENMRIK